MSSLPNPYDTTQNVLWVVDGDHSFFDALTWMDQLTGSDTIKIYNLHGVVKACQSCAIRNSRPVDFLAIFGHGTNGYQSTGAGRRYDQTGTVSLVYQAITPPGQSHLLGPAETTLAGLNGVLSDNATIFLAGCNVGEGDRGDGLLTTISNALNGRTVQAYQNAVYWWMGTMVGFLKEANGNDISSSFTCLSLSISPSD